MTAITLTWNNNYVFTPYSEQYGTNNWIFNLVWRNPNDNNRIMPHITGLYVIESPLGSPIYAGSSDDVRTRFDGRSDVFRHFSLQANAIPNRQVRIATVNPGTQLLLAEQWLVRRLYLRDQAQVAHILQNIQYTNQFNAPNSGLTITNNNPPAYLNANYNYGANTPI